MSERRDFWWTLAVVVWATFVGVYVMAAIPAAVEADGLAYSLGLKLSSIGMVFSLVWLLKARYGGIRARGREA